MTLQTQYLTLLVMSANGALLGAVYDMYRVVLRHWKFLRWAGPIFDFAFWIFAFFAVFWSLMWVNNGDLRLYVFLILGIGFFLYRLLLQKIVIGSTVGIIKGIGYICMTLYKAFLLLVVNPLLYLWRVLLKLLKALDKFLQGLEILILWPFHPLIKFLAWWGRKLVRKWVRPIVHSLKGFWSKLANWSIR